MKREFVQAIFCAPTGAYEDKPYPSRLTDDVFKALAEAGINRIFGFGYDGRKETIEKTVADVLKIKPDTLRVYPTLVVRGTKLEKLYNEKIFTPLTLEEAVEICSKILEPMEEKGIEIIKMGLHSEKSLEENLIAGPYHPSFKEICESRLFCDKIEDEMKKRNFKSAIVFVSPKSISKALGNRRENLEKLSKKGLKINVKICENLSKYEIKIGKE